MSTKHVQKNAIKKGKHPQDIVLSHVPFPVIIKDMSNDYSAPYCSSLLYRYLSRYFSSTSLSSLLLP